MTTVGLSFKGMKDTVFLPSNESSGLVKALLELDDSPTGSDEEFLDFQFKIADAKAREREASEQLSDWRAAFANLQLRQAQEIAEFALHQRNEDEQRNAQQTVELSELRSSLQACELELERVKAENAGLLQHKSELEKDFEQELRYSENLRQNINEHNHMQERLVHENLELKRALDEATVTTGRLKEALVEKASELSAWLGLDGINIQAIPSSILDEKTSLNREEKKACNAHGEDSQGFDTSEKSGAMRSQDANERTDSSRVTDEATTSVQCGAASTSASLDDDCADMKHEVPSERLPSPRETTVRNANDSHRCKGLSVRDLIAEERKSFEHDSSPGKKERILTLEQKIQELQLELDGLQSQHHHSKDDIELWVFKQRSCPSPLTEAVKDDTEFEARLSSDSSSTTEKAEITVSAQPGSSFSNEAGTSADHAKRNAGALGLDHTIPTSNSLPSMADDTAVSQGSPSRYEDGEASWVGSRADLEDKHICTNPNQLWSLTSVSELVESITEELTKLLRVVIKTPSSSLRNSFNDLERRVKVWSNITSKALQSKVSKTGALEEWKELVVDFLSKSRQELITLHQRLHDCEDELSSVDKLRAESLVATQTITFLKDEINKLEAQNFTDHIEREEEVNVLKKDLEYAHTLISAAQRKSSEEHKLALTLKDQLRKVELELEHSKQGWAAEQDFIDSCFGDESGDLFGEDRSFSKKDVDTLEKKVEELTSRLEENERELGELMVISGIDFDAVVSAKLKRMEQRLEDSKASESLVRAEKTELASQVSWLKSKLAEVEHELHLENQQHVEILIRYEEEQGQLEASSRSERDSLNAKVTQLEKLLAEKTKQFETGHPGSPTYQVHRLRANVLALETSLAAERQKGIDSEACMEAHLIKEKDKNNDLETKLTTLQSTVTSLKSELSEAEQREKRAQSQIEKLMIELGIAKEEVLKCEVRMQKTIRQAKEDVDAEKRRLEESHNNQKQMEWHLCRQIELTEGLEREKAKIREVLEEFEIQNLALEKERDDLRTAYMQLARQTAQRVGRGKADTYHIPLRAGLRKDEILRS
ncbi:hypothetical protein Mp_5g05790 [Marchantia polymorpha subsp. ruderalis]|uniref:Uncharacterized protein n=2 Tax=Marchantia polymorpha TaxID=3197 RepID=A0A176WFJ2_MARPO|nr:hypothetical protein AXG93_1276s1030 [Marchantia polymorpha subsp. ruderalis]PTQ42926.1 hypothetical protein MARPO_0027s0048 [Marchantia polymorpha]BBN10708.1 hypothetical protein Mp_5g05790 [Marchantia polymorpha subsp. ruderalis]|eukprot:PTQ42926.1 hypothetical protein MARPO_0027s0048 [Marchantia polymorpha]